jgi:hypothetical protein
VTQSVVFDSDKPTAKIIGIEYIISEDIFKTLPNEEKRFWHSHAYIIKSGVAVVPEWSDKQNVDSVKDLVKTYGKCIHTWAIDKNPELPLGPPEIMMVFNKDG